MPLHKSQNILLSKLEIELSLQVEFKTYMHVRAFKARTPAENARATYFLDPSHSKQPKIRVNELH